jgi:hypothetical protein
VGSHILDILLSICQSAGTFSTMRSADMDFVLERAREYLGTTCDAQLRLVSRSFRDLLVAVPHEDLRIEDFLSSASLFVWARRELRMPKRADIAVMAARGAHLDVLKWLRAEEGRCSWTSSVCFRAAEQGHLHVLEWLRIRRPPCPWDGRTCDAAARKGHLVVLQWLRAQHPPCPWYETCNSAAGGGQLVVLQWLRAQDPPCGLRGLVAVLRKVVILACFNGCELRILLVPGLRRLVTGQQQKVI